MSWKIAWGVGSGSVWVQVRSSRLRPPYARPLAFSYGHLHRHLLARFLAPLALTSNDDESKSRGRKAVCVMAIAA